MEWTPRFNRTASIHNLLRVSVPIVSTQNNLGFCASRFFRPIRVDRGNTLVIDIGVVNVALGVYRCHTGTRRQGDRLLVLDYDLGERGVVQCGVEMFDFDAAHSAVAVLVVPCPIG